MKTVLKYTFVLCVYYLLIPNTLAIAKNDLDAIPLEKYYDTAHLLSISNRDNLWQSHDNHNLLKRIVWTTQEIERLLLPQNKITPTSILEGVILKNVKLGAMIETRIGYKDTSTYNTIPIIEVFGRYTANVLREDVSISSNTLKQIKLHPYQWGLRIFPELLVYDNLALHALFGIDYMHIITPIALRQFHLLGATAGIAIKYYINDNLSIRLDGMATVFAKHNHANYLLNSMRLNQFVYSKVMLTIQYYP